MKNKLMTIFLFSLALISCENGGTSSTFTITWKNWDGTILEVDKNVEKGSSPKYDGTEPTKSNTPQYTYTFSGWSPEITVVISDATYVAQFKETTNEYEIKFINDKGTELKRSNVPFGDMPTYIGTPESEIPLTKQHWKFKGWNPVIKEVSGPATYQATYDKCAKIVWKNYDGSLYHTDEDVIVGTNIVKPEVDPKKDIGDGYNYLFENWMNGAMPYTPGTEANYDTTYIAAFTKGSPIEYKITYELNGGDEPVVANPTKYTVEDNDITLNNPTKTDQTFAGWFDNPNLTGEKVTKIIHGSIGDINLYAKWIDAAQYKITTTYTALNVYMMMNDGTNNIFQTQVVDENNGLVYPGVPTRDGYIFIGWYKEASCTNLFDFSQQVTNHCKVYAKWEQVEDTDKCIDIYPTDGSKRVGVNKNEKVYFPILTDTTFRLEVKYTTNYASSGVSRFKIYKKGQARALSSIEVNEQAALHYQVMGECTAKPGDVFYFIAAIDAADSVLDISLCEYENNPISYPASGGKGKAITIQTDVNFGEDYFIEPHPGNNFIGWFDYQVGGTQFTDEDGYSLKPWDLTTDKTLYPQFSN